MDENLRKRSVDNPLCEGRDWAAGVIVEDFDAVNLLVDACFDSADYREGVEASDAKAATALQRSLGSLPVMTTAL